MHEMGIATQIIEIAKNAIPSGIENARVESVNIKVGKLSAVVPASLRFCFEIASKETLLSGASLNIEEIPVKALCKSCKNRWTINEPVFTCPECGEKTIDILSGRELDVVSIEVAEPKS